MITGGKAPELLMLGAPGVAGHEPCGLGAMAQPARLPTIAATDHAAQADGQRNTRKFIMGLILLEALLALLVLVVIVWWTMFSGRSKGELPAPKDSSDTDKP
jgi:hypothetical protein